MSLETGFGQVHNVLDEKPEYARRLKVTSPILMKEKYDVLYSFGDEKSPRYNAYYKNRVFSTTFKSNLKESLEKLASYVIKAVKQDGVSVVILDDRSINENEKVIPCAMAVGYVNQRLLKEEIRHSVSIVAVTGEVYDPHMAAVLIAFGCTAIYPYMMYASTVSFFQREKPTKYEMQKYLKILKNLLMQDY